MYEEVVVLAPLYYNVVQRTTLCSTAGHDLRSRVSYNSYTLHLIAHNKEYSGAFQAVPRPCRRDGELE